MTLKIFTKNERLVLGGFILISLGWFIAMVAFRAALESTPYELTDSMGRTMGFNDVFSREHYGLVFERITVARTLAYLDFYDGAFIFALLLGLWQLGRNVSVRWMKIYSALQFILFPMGFFGLLGALIMLFQIAKGIVPTSDREGFIDIPFIPMFGHAPWLLCSLWIGYYCWRNPRERSQPIIRAEKVS